MNQIQQFLELLFQDMTINSRKENNKLFEIEVNAGRYTPKELSVIEKSLMFVSPNDFLTVTVVFGNADPISLFYSVSQELYLTTFIEQLNQEYLHQDGESIVCSLNISKNIVNNCLSIYDLDVFTGTISSLTASQFLYIFNSILVGNEYIIFQTHNLKETFNSNSLYFVPFNIISINHCCNSKIKKLEFFKSICHYSNFESHKLLPDDFRFNLKPDNYPILIQLFERYSILLSIIFLFDISSLTDNKLEYKINGYKTISSIFEFSNIDLISTKDYFEIFEWVYNGGNLNDKIGLARNIITLHFQNTNNINLQGNPFESVKSSFKIYEKQNINQYIEIRNKISDQLLEFNSKANRIVDNFASGFQKSALALITFYSSAIVIRVLSKGNFENIFSLDATILSFAFIIGSLIYYFVARWEIKTQRERFVNIYNNLKERYTDLLEISDIVRILNSDKDFDEDIKYIDSKTKMFSWLWICLMIIFSITTLTLFLCYNLSTIYDSFIFRILFNNNIVN